MTNFDLSQAVGNILGLVKLKDGDPCLHLGCLSHISHPCEGCGRLGGRYNYAADMNTAWVLIKPMAKAGCNFKLISYFGESYRAIFSPIGSGSGGRFIDEHAPTAILKAAARALGVLDN